MKYKSYLNKRLLLILSGIVMLVNVENIMGQPVPALPIPQLEIVSPLGAKIGSTVEVTVTGVDLDDLQSLIFNHPGIRAEKIIPPPPKEPKRP